MPNLCDFTIKAVGKEESLNTLLEILKNDYHYCDSDSALKFEKDYKYNFIANNGTHLLTNADKHMYRIFDAYEDGLEKEDDEMFSTIVFGDCAWSVNCCMFNSTFSYYIDRINDVYSELRKKHSTTIVDLSEELDLDVEIYSYEPGCCFAEHYLIKKGELLADETYDYQEYCIGDFPEGTLKSEAEKEYEIYISDEEWDDRFGDHYYIFRCEIDPNDPEWEI